jgi:tetratricopeptide (TPR) repeat protein
VDALKVALNPDEDARLGAKGTQNLEAYDYAIRGRELGWRFAPETNLEAASLLRKAIELDPNFAMPHTFLSMGLSLDYINGWNGATEATLEECMELAERAQQISDTDPQGYWAMAVVCMWRGDLDRASAEIERAIALEPNLAEAHAIRGNILGYSGSPAEAAASVQAAMRLDPQYPDMYLHFLGHAYLLLGDYEAAAEQLTRRIRRYPETDSSRLLLASCYGHLGKKDAAVNIGQELMLAQPDFTVENRGQVLPYKNPADWQRILDGLKKAGLPES